MQVRHAALDVQEFLRAQIRTETGLGNGVVSQLQRSLGGHDGVAPVGDVGKGTAVDEGGGPFQGLDQVGLEGIHQQGGHRALGLQVMGGDRGTVKGIAHDDSAQTGL